MNQPPPTDKSQMDEEITTGDAAKARRRQRALTLSAVAGALVVGVVLFTAGSRSTTTPPVSAPTGPAQTAAVTTGPPGPTAPTVSVVDSTPVGPDALAIGSSGTFSNDQGSGVVTVRSAIWQQEAAGPGTVLPVIEVEIQVTSGQFAASLGNFGLQDSKGIVYPPLSGVVDEQLASGEVLDAGESTSGFVAFDAPRQQFTLVFAGPDAKALLTWRMPE